MGRDDQAESGPQVLLRTISRHRRIVPFVKNGPQEYLRTLQGSRAHRPQAPTSAPQSRIVWANAPRFGQKGCRQGAAQEPLPGMAAVENVFSLLQADYCSDRRRKSPQKLHKTRFGHAQQKGRTQADACA